MKDFRICTPTEVVFGVESELKTAEMVKKHGGTKVLLHYGGKSAVKSGLINLIKSLLDEAAIPYISLDGVVPNPRLSKVYEGIELCRRAGVDFILAVGGGSVIDSAKAIAYGLSYEGDVWDFYAGKAQARGCFPVGAILTIPAAGSEMSDSSVITNEKGNLKRGYNNDLCRPKFAIMNPQRSFTLPPFQTACGVTDIMMHTMERYFSHDDDMAITDALAEGLLRTVKECGRKVMDEPENYVLRAQLMWAGSLAHNGLTGCGTTSDFATHQIEHELSAMFDVAHGAGLAAVWPHWARYTYMENPLRFARFAVNVLKVTNDFKSQEKTSLEGINEMERFYRSIGMPVNIPGLIGRRATNEELRTMALKCSRDRSRTVGQLKKLDYDDLLNIYKMANEVY